MGWIECVTLCISPSKLLTVVGIINLSLTSTVGHQTVAVHQRLLTPKYPQTPASPPAPIVPTFSSFNSQQLDQQLQRYLRYLVEFGPPDILIVGSSRALQGVDPLTLQQSLASNGYPNLKIFNFGVNGATAQVVDFLLRRLLTAEQLPRLVLWADGVRAFNSGRIDQTYNRLQASEGYKRVLAGEHPQLPVRALPFPARFCLDWPPLFEIRQPENQPKSVTPKRPLVQPGFLFRCWYPLHSSPPNPVNESPEAIAALRQSLGFHSIATRFHPPVYFQRYPRVQGQFDADYSNFSLQSRQTAALNQVLRFAQIRNIPVVLANLPLTPTYLDRTRTRYEEQFQTFLKQLARSRQVTVFNLNIPQLGHNHYFMDPSHLNSHGAKVVSERLAKELASRLPELW